MPPILLLSLIYIGIGWSGVEPCQALHNATHQGREGICICNNLIFFDVASKASGIAKCNDFSRSSGVGRVVKIAEGISVAYPLVAEINLSQIARGRGGSLKSVGENHFGASNGAEQRSEKKLGAARGHHQPVTAPSR